MTVPLVLALATSEPSSSEGFSWGRAEGDFRERGDSGGRTQRGPRDAIRVWCVFAGCVPVVRSWQPSRGRALKREERGERALNAIAASGDRCASTSQIVPA